MLHRLGWGLSGALAVVAILALARATVAGPLDPPGPVGSTMRTLDELAPSWGKTLSSSGGCNSQRFQCVMAGNVAVLDRETGLVWLRNPIETFTPYESARGSCVFSETGGRSGWRLPTSTEIFSLIDSSADSLPDGHPFQNVSGGPYWTTTVYPDDDQMVQTVGMFGGFNEELAKSRYGSDGFSQAAAWCVRGGQTMADDAAPAELPAWSRTLSAEGGCDSARFECVMNGVAVLDRETGLVWQQAPSATVNSYNERLNACIEATTGGRRGWRLPTYYEAVTLLDPSVAGTVKLPAGHPFEISAGLTTANFATASTFLSTGSYIPFDLAGGFGNFTKIGGSSVAGWCVRGPGGEYAY